VNGCLELVDKFRCLPLIVCGDGVLGPGEVCDDGNAQSGDGCPETCSYIEPGYVCPTSGALCERVDGGFCGDGVVEPDLGERCDDGVNGGGYGECAPGCVLGPYCGDGVVQGAYEQCDDGNNVAGDGCSPDCLTKLE
jgi:cysteine-rich repeat protein